MKKIVACVGKTLVVMLVIVMVVITIEWLAELWVANEFNKENTTEQNVEIELTSEPTDFGFTDTSTKLFISNDSAFGSVRIPVDFSYKVRSDGSVVSTTKIGENYYEINQDGSLAKMPTFLDAGETIATYVAYPIILILGGAFLLILLWGLIFSPVFVFLYFVSKEPKGS